MDLIGARKVQPPEAVAHGTDSHIATIYKNPCRHYAYGDFYIVAVWLSVPCATASGGWTMRAPIKSIIIDNAYKIKVNIFSFNS